MAAEKVFRLGILAPFTGPAAKTGDEFKATVKMALGKIKNRIGDYKIEPVWIDSQSDPAKGANAYSEAAERDGGIQAGLFGWHSSVGVACMEEIAKYRIPHLFTFQGAEIINDKWKSNPDKYCYYAKAWPTPRLAYIGYVECINDALDKGSFRPDNRRVAIYGEDSDWGRGVGTALKEWFAKTGWEIFSVDYFDAKQTDFYPLMNKYKKGKVSVICGTCSMIPTFSSFIKQSEEVGVKALIIADGLGWFGNWYEMTGPSSNHVLDMIPQLTTTKSREWAKEFREKYGYAPSPIAGALAYDGMNFFFKIARRTLEKHGELNKKSIFDVYIKEVATGKLTYSDQDGAMIMKEYRYKWENMPDPVVAKDAFYFPVIQYMEGKGNIVYPSDWKQADFKVRKK